MRCSGWARFCPAQLILLAIPLSDRKIYSATPLLEPSASHPAARRRVTSPLTEALPVSRRSVKIPAETTAIGELREHLWFSSRLVIPEPSPTFRLFPLKGSLWMLWDTTFKRCRNPEFFHFRGLDFWAFGHAAANLEAFPGGIGHVGPYAPVKLKADLSHSMGGAVFARQPRREVAG